MRLVRITTENENCFFESTFNSDLIINPYSKIALSSFTTQLNNLEMVIDSQNNEISYSVDGLNKVKTLTLPNGVYTPSDVGNFWLSVTKLFNESMEYTRNQINRQWRCSMVGGRSSFEFKYGTIIKPLSATSTNLFTTKNVVNYTTGGLLVRSPTIAPVGNDAYLYMKSPNNKGASSLRAKLYADNVVGTASGFVLGYTLANPKISTQIINPQDYIYGIRYVDLTQPYKYIINGVDYTLPIQPETMPQPGDTMEISIFNGSIYFTIYRDATNDFTILHTYTGYNHQTDLFPLCLFVGVDTIINNIQFTSDPFYNIVNTHTTEPILNTNNNIVVIPTKEPPTQCMLQFNNPDLAQILGFNNTRYPLSGFESKSQNNYLAENPFELRDFSESYLIELLNIKLNSMDGLVHGEKSILYVIPQLSTIKEHVIFEAPQLIFLNINNTYPLNLREIKCRVLKDTLSQIKCYGLSTIVLIIKDKDEI